MPNALSDALCARFLSDLAEATEGRADARFGLCVSGGPDSLALMLLAVSSGLDCEAATVDHGLRPEALAEARTVADVANSLGIQHQILTITAPVSGNVSAWARSERYRALLAWAEAQQRDFLLTAHHADDQLETMIMRLNRGSGVAGLAGVRAQRDGLARPLLGWRKAELEALVLAAGLEPCDDPSNRDDRFDRARLRKALAGADWLDPLAANRSARALAEAEAALVWAATAYEGRRVAARDGVISFAHSGLPQELKRRITLACLRRVNDLADPRGEELDRLMQGLAAGRVAALAGVKCTGGEFWLFSLAPPRRFTP
ncbi:MAG: hypothetical protein RIS52_2612 [Pseudomonadota bacterium]